jgi:cell division protein FtsB
MMNQRRRIFFAIFGGYHMIILFFTFYIGSKNIDFGVLAKLYAKISMLKYGAILGVVLFVVDFVWNWIETKNAEKEQEALRLENNTLKAKVYDFQQAAKPVVNEKPNSDSSKSL